MKLSIICPIYNNAPSISELVEEIIQETQKCSAQWELILVDDRSTDSSWSKINEVSNKHPEIKGIRLSRNFGQQVAVSAGLRHSSGDILIVMDGDLQDPPEVLAQFIERWRQGIDVVYAIRTKRKES